MDRLRCMRVFARVAHASSFAAAGRELGLSSASVTKMVAALESELGARLLERTTRRVQLTEAGRFYLDRCLETLHSLDDADAAMSQLSRKPTGILRLTAPLDFARDMASVVALYAERSPEVTVELRFADHNIDLIDQGLDLGIGLPAPSHASYISRPLCTTYLGVYAAPSYLATYGTPRKLSDLAKHRHIVFTEPEPRTRWTFRKGQRSVEVELTPVIRSNNGPALMYLCSNGMGLCVGPSFVADEHIRRGTITRVLTDYELPSLRFYVRYPSRRFLPAKVRSFLECLREHFGDDPDADAWRGA